jgi:hypothetical protein
MKRLEQLLEKWQSEAAKAELAQELTINLNQTDAARVNALADLYPKLTSEEVVVKLLNIALDEVEASFPYIKGTKVVAQDEEGDPIYEDQGLTPKYLELTRKHYKLLKKSAH